MTNIQYSEQPTKEQRQRWQAQEKIIFDAFRGPCTMLQVEQVTGIMRPNVCRAVAKWKRAGTIRVVRVDKDPLTGCRAQFLSTNPNYWPRPAGIPGIQSDLFR